ncbi:hypothetical protein [Paracoccus sp. (in: a-proteobacteria)]|uniref:hypothetical protein n=1 Tax=Paracoccus sp. TaxID=267 RepID=UPI002AFEBBAB|nr:hypothetical protein [Paracoccus sp. (in: a-proteobacteria)]
MNLAPLIERAQEIRALAQRAMQEQIEAKSLRKQINKLFGRIRALDCGSAEGAADAILPNHRPSTIQSFQRLKQIAAALEAVLDDFSTGAGGGELSHRCDISTLPNTNLNQINKTCRAEKMVGSRPIRTTPEQVWFLASDRFREYLAFYAEGVGRGGAPDERCLIMAAQDFALSVGVPAGEWRRCCDALGGARTALCLLIADRN